MNWGIRGCLCVAAVVCLSAQAADTGVKITVRVYNYAGVSPHNLERAEREAARVYTKAGIETEWLECPLRPGEEKDYPACELPAASTRLTARLLPRAMAERTGFSGGETFGFALLPEHGFGLTANVFADRSAELAKGDPELDATLLGDLMAHELGHLLLGAGSHSASGGIMHVPWHKKELDLIRQGSMGFMPWETEKMRWNVRERTVGDRAGGATGVP